MRLLVCSWILLLSLLPALAKSGDKQEWLETVYDFGVINEADGIRECVFRLVNNGRKKLKISRVSPACGCTEVEFPSHNISRGDTAMIVVKFDPEERPGKFDKGIYVFLNDEKLPVNLRIKGVVTASPETLSLFYPIGEGSLHFDVPEIDFGEVTPGLRRREFLDIYNSGTSVISPVIQSDSNAISWEPSVPEILPGEGVTLILYLDSAKLGWPGRKNLSVTLDWNDQDLHDRQQITIPVAVTLLPNPHF